MPGHRRQWGSLRPHWPQAGDSDTVTPPAYTLALPVPVARHFSCQLSPVRGPGVRCLGFALKLVAPGRRVRLRPGVPNCQSRHG